MSNCYCKVFTFTENGNSPEFTWQGGALMAVRVFGTMGGASVELVSKWADKEMSLYTWITAEGRGFTVDMGWVLQFKVTGATATTDIVIVVDEIVA